MSWFCVAVLCVLSTFEMILLRKRELVASFCILMSLSHCALNL